MREEVETLYGPVDGQQAAELSTEEKQVLRRKLKQFYEQSLRAGQSAYFRVCAGELVPTPMGRHWMGEHLSVCRDLLALERTDVFLDLGCGEGYYTTALCRQAGVSLGIDISRSVLELLRSLKTYDRSVVHLVEADVEHIPLASGVVDKALCSHLLEHVLDDEAVVRELYRILRPGGTAVFAVPLKFTPQHRLLTRITDVLRAMLKPGKKGTPVPAPGRLNRALVGRQAHIRHHSLSSFHLLLESQGFEVQRTAGIFFHDPRNWLVHRTQRNIVSYKLGTWVSKRFPQMGAAVVVKTRKPDIEASRP